MLPTKEYTTVKAYLILNNQNSIQNYFTYLFMV